jgi:hypothetical protein
MLQGRLRSILERTDARLAVSSQWTSRLVATNGPNERGRHQLSGDYGGTEPPGIRFIQAAKGYPSRKLA